MSGRPAESKTPASLAGQPWFARVLGRLGVAPADGLPGRAGTLTWYAVAVVALGMVVPQAFNLATGRPVVFVQNPLLVLQAGILVGAAAATESLHQRYDRAVERSNLIERTSEPAVFDGLVPDRLSVALVAAGVGFTLLNAFVLIGVPTLYEAGGPTRVFRFVVVAPLGQVPILATFLATGG